MTNATNVLPCREVVYRYQLIDECLVIGTVYSEIKQSNPFGSKGLDFDDTYSIKEMRFKEWNTSAIDRDEVVRLLDYVIEIVAMEGDASVPKSALLAYIGIKE